MQRYGQNFGKVVWMSTTLPYRLASFSVGIGIRAWLERTCKVEVIELKVTSKLIPWYGVLREYVLLFYTKRLEGIYLFLAALTTFHDIFVQAVIFLTIAVI